MRKILLGTSALVAVGFVAVPAMAQLNLTVSGFYRFDAAYVDESGEGPPAPSPPPVRTSRRSSPPAITISPAAPGWCSTPPEPPTTV